MPYSRDGRDNTTNVEQQQANSTTNMASGSPWYQAIMELEHNKDFANADVTQNHFDTKPATIHSSPSTIVGPAQSNSSVSTSQPPSEEDELAKTVTARYDAYIKRVYRRKEFWSRRNVKRHRIRAQLEPFEAQTKFVSIGRLERVPDDKTVIPVSNNVERYGYFTGDYSSKWNEIITLLKQGLDAKNDLKGSLFDAPPLAKDARSWYNRIMESEDEPLDWQDLRNVLRKELQDRRRRELRLRIGLEPQSESSSKLEHQIWQKAQHKLRFHSKNGSNSEHYAKKVWREALLYVLTESPTDTLRFLQRTHNDPFPSRSMIAEALEYSIAWSDRHAAANSTWWRLASNTIQMLATAGTEQPLPIHGSYLTTVLKRLPVEEVFVCITDWELSGLSLQGNTVLHATHILAKSGFCEQAVKLLETHTDSVATYASKEALQSVLASVLRSVSQSKDGLHVCQELVTRMVERGVVLNLQLCNIIMLNAVEANDLDTAFNLYSTLKNNNINPDKYTFSILAKGCKSVAADEQNVARVIDDALRSGVLLTEPVVAGEVLHALYKHHLDKRRGEAYRLLIEAYEQLFDRSAVEKLGIIGSASSSRPSNPIQPDAPVIGIVVDAYLGAARTTPLQAVTLYQRILNLAKEGVHPFPELLESDYMSNAFIAFFGSKASTMLAAMEVLRVMRSQLNPAASSVDSDLEHADNTTVKDCEDWLMQESDFDGLSRITVGILQSIYAKHSDPSNKLLGPAEYMLQFMLRKHPSVRPKNLMETLHAYLRHEDGDGAEWCVDRLAEMDMWDEVKGAWIRRMIVDARAKRMRASQFPARGS